MKQSTFSAVMANSIKNLLQGYTKGIRFVAVLTVLLTMGIGQIWASDANNARIYFDNTNSKWTYVQLVGGHSSWSSGTALTKITNTNNLWTTGWSWGGYTYFMFIDASGSWEGQGTEAWNRKGNFNYSATITHNVGSNTYFYFPSSSNKNTGYTTSEKINSYSSLNYNQTVQQQLSTNGGTSYAASTISIATVKVSSFSLGSATATSATSNSKTISSGQSSATCSAARTATVTYTVSDVKAGYTFVGWYDGNTQKSTETTYDAYQATGAKTITARFTLATYTVKWVVDGQEQATETVDHGKKPTKAPAMDSNNPICGDKFVGWVTTPIEGQLKDASKLTIYATDNLPAITGETTFYAVFADYE